MFSVTENEVSTAAIRQCCLDRQCHNVVVNEVSSDTCHCKISDTVTTRPVIESRYPLRSLWFNRFLSS